MKSFSAYRLMPVPWPKITVDRPSNIQILTNYAMFGAMGIKSALRFSS